MSSMLKKCFLCTKESQKVFYLSPEESLLMFTRILGIPEWKDDVQKLKFEKACYCLKCLNRIVNIQNKIKSLEQLEEEISRGKSKIESQLRKSCKKSEDENRKNEMTNKSLPVGMLQGLRNEIVSALKSNSNSSKNSLIDVGIITKNQKCEAPSPDDIQITPKKFANKKTMTNTKKLQILLGNDAWTNTEKLKISARNDAWTNTMNSKISVGNNAWTNTDNSQISLGNDAWTNTDNSHISLGNDAWTNTDNSQISLLNDAWTNTDNLQISHGNDAWTNTENSQISHGNDAWTNTENLQIPHGDNAWMNTEYSQISLENHSWTNTECWIPPLMVLDDTNSTNNHTIEIAEPMQQTEQTNSNSTNLPITYLPPNDPTYQTQTSVLTLPTVPVSDSNRSCNYEPEKSKYILQLSPPPPFESEENRIPQKTTYIYEMKENFEVIKVTKVQDGEDSQEIDSEEFEILHQEVSVAVPVTSNKTEGPNPKLVTLQHDGKLITKMPKLKTKCNTRYTSKSKVSDPCSELGLTKQNSTKSNRRKISQNLKNLKLQCLSSLSSSQPQPMIVSGSRSITLEQVFQEHHRPLKLKSNNKSMSTYLSQRKNKDFKCRFCKRSFTFKSSLDRHASIRHPKSVRNMTVLKDCKECRKPFSSHQFWRSHVQMIPRARKIFQCPKCKYKYFGPISLRIHMMVRHSSNSICNFCDKEFKWRKSLYIHKIIKHGKGMVNAKSTDLLYKICKVCGKFSRTENVQKIHGSIFHRTRPKFQCGRRKCEYEGFCPTALQNHKVAEHPQPT